MTTSAKDVNRDQQNSNKGGDQLIGQQLNQMLVIFLYMEVLLFSNQKVPYKACKVSKPTSYKNAQHQNQLRCWSTEAPVLFVSINVFGFNIDSTQFLYSVAVTARKIYRNKVESQSTNKMRLMPLKRSHQDVSNVF